MTFSALQRIVSILQVFWQLNYRILMFFRAYIGIYRTPASWYGQEPYLGPVHKWPWQNMAVRDEEIALKWAGITNAHLKFSVSYGFGIFFDRQQKPSLFSFSSSPTCNCHCHSKIQHIILPNLTYTKDFSWTVDKVQLYRKVIKVERRR